MMVGTVLRWNEGDLCNILRDGLEGWCDCYLTGRGGVCGAELVG